MGLFTKNGKTSTTTAVETVGPDTPESDAGTMTAKPNPFETPYGSMPPSALGSTTGFAQPQRNYFHSRRVRKGEVERPWMEKKDPKEKWVTIIPLIGILAGLALSGFLIWDGLNSVTNYTYCTILEENWSSGFDTSVWTKEVQSGGYQFGEFEVTTNTEENVYIQDDMLYIKPTLQEATLVETDGTFINLTAQGICTSDTYNDCFMMTNSTNGTIVNPVKSGRITTRKSKSIKYGRVEVEVKLPTGDWIWPSIIMLPVEETYGSWPASGEIDIMESRGNNFTYEQGGNNIVSSELRFGPDGSSDDGGYMTNVKRKALHTTYSSGFHTFGIEWSPKYIFSYIDTRLLQVMYVKFDESFWTRGDFSTNEANGTIISDPWTGNVAPFDEDFYLVISCAVGATNGWFNDGRSGKPWLDASAEAPLQFWNARDTWYPTWEDNGHMIVKSVKIMQQAGFNGCNA